MAPAKKSSGPGRYYEIVVDYITGSVVSDREAAPHEIKPLAKGIYSQADLVAAGCDIAWLVKCGSIVELDYVPISAMTNG